MSEQITDSINAYEDNIVVCGAHWQGKSFFTAWGLLTGLMQVANVWTWNYHSEHNGILGNFAKEGKPVPSHMIKHTVDEMEYGTNFIAPLDRSEANFEKFLAKALTFRDLLIVVDESHNYSSAHKLKGNHKELIKNAGNQNIGYMEIFQRPQNVHGDVLENARHRFCFALDNLNSVKYMSQWIGLEVELFLAPQNRSSQGKKFLGDQEMLPEHSYIYRDKKKLTPVIVSGGLQL